MRGLEEFFCRSIHEIYQTYPNVVFITPVIIGAPIPKMLVESSHISLALQRDLVLAHRDVTEISLSLALQRDLVLAY